MLIMNFNEIFALGVEADSPQYARAYEDYKRTTRPQSKRMGFILSVKHFVCAAWGNARKIQSSKFC